MKLRKVEVQNYRSLANAELALPGLTVLIGANGSGKTTVLDVFKLISESSTGNLGDAISKRGGIDGLMSRFTNVDAQNDKLTIRIEVEIEDKAPLIYELLIKSERGFPVVKKEQLSQEQHGRGKKPFYFLSREGNYAVFTSPEKQKGFEKLSVNADQLGLEVMSKTYDIGEQFRGLLKNVTYNSGFDIGQRSQIRLPQDARTRLFPGEQGEWLFSCLHNLRTHEHDIFQYLLDVLSAGFPYFRRMEFPIPADRKMSLNWYDSTSTVPFDQSELSDGTLRFLWLVTALLSPERPDLILLDEPEISLHPHLLALLADVLQNSSQDSQILVATHSDMLVRALKPEEVVTVDKTENGSKLERLSEGHLADWLKDYSLDQLWSKKVIGGQS
jgi:predicted ATPase